MPGSRKKKSILVIGGTAAGPSAAAKARQISEDADITLFEATDTVSYGICESPYFLGGSITDESKLIVYTPDQLEKEKGIRVKCFHWAEEIYPAANSIKVRDLKNRSETVYEFDKLILATGSAPLKLNVEGEDSKNVFFLKSRDDVRAIHNYLRTEKPTQAMIIGGGYIGIEIAESFRARGMEVGILDKSDLPVEGYEKELRETIFGHLLDNGIEFIPSATVEKLQDDNSGKIGYVLTNRGAFKTDLVIISAGVGPNIRLAKESGLRIGKTGAISVDKHQQTSRDDIYAAGDCSEVRDIVSGLPAYVPLANIASRSGRVAGENASGLKSVFPGVINASAFKMFGMEVARIGLGSKKAAELGYKTVVEKIQAPLKPKIMPDPGMITIILTADKSTGRLLGANLCGQSGVIMRANLLGVAVQSGMTVSDVSNFDFIYNPAVSPLWDPVIIAANQASKQLKKSIRNYKL